MRTGIPREGPRREQTAQIELSKVLLGVFSNIISESNEAYSHVTVAIQKCNYELIINHV